MIVKAILKINPSAEVTVKGNDINTCEIEIGDQLDMLWHSIDQDAELKQKYFDFYQAIKSVKVKYPKNG